MSAVRGRVLLTIGDPNGIGPEIAVKAAVGLHDDHSCRPVIVGDRHIVEPLAERLGFRVRTNHADWGGQGKTVDLHEVEELAPDDFRPGDVSAAAGRATVGYVQTSVGLLREGVGRAIVACPHSETAVNSSGRRFSGYPNLLSEILGTGPDSVFLMLVGGGLRVVHATLHEATKVALDRLTPRLIEDAAASADKALRALGIEHPRIGLFGINPHAGEGGLFGNEDDRIVRPAVESLMARGIDAVGPEGADAMLVRDGFDAFVAMYHDQGHIPVKLKAGRASAALSIGGGLLFSSVGHGAGFDIAGKNIADPAGVIQAIRLVGGSN
jgi:4-hydroxy-L-threonine phosphate dehydrogenase PdxA